MGQAHPLDRAVGGDERARCGSPRGSRSRRSAGTASPCASPGAGRHGLGCRSALLADPAACAACAHHSTARSRAAPPRRAGCSFLELVEVRGERRRWRPGAALGHVRPDRVQQLLDRAAALAERRDQAALAIQAVRDVLVELARAASHTGGPWPGQSTSKSSRSAQPLERQQVAGHRARIGADEDAALAQHGVAGEAGAGARSARSGRRRGRAWRPPRRARSARRRSSCTSASPRAAASGAGQRSSSVLDGLAVVGVVVGQRHAAEPAARLDARPSRRSQVLLEQRARVDDPGRVAPDDPGVGARQRQRPGVGRAHAQDVVARAAPRAPEPCLQGPGRPPPPSAAWRATRSCLRR